MTKRRQTAAQFARLYAAIKADLLATEGAKVFEFNLNRAEGRRVEAAPTRHQRHQAQSNQHRQQGAL